MGETRSGGKRTEAGERRQEPTGRQTKEVRSVRCGECEECEEREEPES